MILLARAALEDLLSSRLPAAELIAPVRIEGRLYYQAVDPGQGLKEVAWPRAASAAASGPAGDPLPVNSIKEFFFPRRQELYELRPGGIVPPAPAAERARQAGRLRPGGRSAEESRPRHRDRPQHREESRPRHREESRPRLLLFVRPCEARALTILDRLFLGERRDESYASFRDSTTIVGLSCLQPDARCFCLSVGGGPFDTEGLDLALTQLDEELYAAAAISGKGEKLLAGAAQPAGREAGQAEAEALAALRRKAEGALSRSIRVPQPDEMRRHFDSEYWRQVSASCLACGICSYLCPTCHCFDIVDEGYLRLRCWDTCSSATFTRMAAGEDHRRQKHSRYRQRVYHKFSYFRESFDTVACVGCGRCARHCPVKIDIAGVVNGLGGPAGGAEQSAAGGGRRSRSGGEVKK